jgi:hypothetical protein
VVLGGTAQVFSAGRRASLLKVTFPVPPMLRSPVSGSPLREEEVRNGSE